MSAADNYVSAAELDDEALEQVLRLPGRRLDRQIGLQHGRECPRSAASGRRRLAAARICPRTITGCAPASISADDLASARPPRRCSRWPAQREVLARLVLRHDQVADVLLGDRRLAAA